MSKQFVLTFVALGFLLTAIFAYVELTKRSGSDDVVTADGWKTHIDNERGFSFRYPPTSYLGIDSLKDCPHTPVVVIQSSDTAYLVNDRVYENRGESCDNYHLTTMQDIDSGRAFVFYLVASIPIDSEKNLEKAIQSHFGYECVLTEKREWTDRSYMSSLFFEVKTDDPDIFMSAGCNSTTIVYNANRKRVYITPTKGNAPLLWTSPTEYADDKYELEYL